MQTVPAWSPPLSQVAPPARTVPIVLAISLNVLFVYGLGVGLHVIPTFTSKPVTEATFVPAEKKIVDEPTTNDLSKTGPAAFNYLATEPTIIVGGDDWPPKKKTGPTDETGDVVEPQTLAVVAPRILSGPEPQYPSISRLKDEEGVVYVRVTVSPFGDVVATQLEKSSGYTRLDETALKAVRGWRFSPSMRGAEAIAGSTVVLVRFRLQK